MASRCAKHVLASARVKRRYGNLEGAASLLRSASLCLLLLTALCCRCCAEELESATDPIVQEAAGGWTWVTDQALQLVQEHWKPSLSWSILFVVMRFLGCTTERELMRNVQGSRLLCNLMELAFIAGLGFSSVYVMSLPTMPVRMASMVWTRYLLLAYYYLGIPLLFIAAFVAAVRVPPDHRGGSSYSLQLENATLLTCGRFLLTAPHLIVYALIDFQGVGVWTSICCILSAYLIIATSLETSVLQFLWGKLFGRRMVSLLMFYMALACGQIFSKFVILQAAIAAAHQIPPSSSDNTVYLSLLVAVRSPCILLWVAVWARKQIAELPNVSGRSEARVECDSETHLVLLVCSFLGCTDKTWGRLLAGKSLETLPEVRQRVAAESA